MAALGSPMLRSWVHREARREPGSVFGLVSRRGRSRIVQDDGTQGGDDYMSSHRERLEDLGLPVADVQALIGESLSSLTEASNGLQELAKRYPDFQRRVPELAEMLRDPNWQARAAVDPVATAEYAFLKLRSTQPDASGSQGGIIRDSRYSARQPMNAMDADKLSREQYAKMRIRQVVSSKHLGLPEGE